MNLDYTPMKAVAVTVLLILFIFTFVWMNLDGPLRSELEDLGILCGVMLATGLAAGAALVSE